MKMPDNGLLNGTLNRLSRLLRKPTLEGQSSTWRRLLAASDAHKVIITFWCSIGYIGLGASCIIFGTSILDFSATLHVSIGVLSGMFGFRALGIAIGSVSSGVALDNAFQYAYIIVCGLWLFQVLITAALPLSVNIYMLAAFSFLGGLGKGALDNGVHVVLLTLWKENCGPCMQSVHFAFSIGSVLGPLIAGQFISSQQPGQHSPASAGSGASMNGTTEPFHTEFQVTYFVVALMQLPTFLAFVFYAVRYDLVDKFCSKHSANYDKKLGRAIPEHDQKGLELMEENLEVTAAEGIVDEEFSLLHSAPIADKGDMPPPTELELRMEKVTFWFKVAIMGVLGVSIFLYLGAQVAYGNLILAVTVTGSLHFSKKMGAVLQSIFFLAFSLTRCFSIVLALCNVRTIVMLLGNLFGSLLASTIMIILPDNAVAIWLGSVVLGMSYASIYPTTITWMSETVTITGKTTSVFITGASVGVAVIPVLVGVLISKVSENSLFYAVFADIVISIISFVLMFFLAFLKEKTLDRVQREFKEKADEKME